MKNNSKNKDAWNLGLRIFAIFITLIVVSGGVVFGAGQYTVTIDNHHQRIDENTASIEQVQAEVQQSLDDIRDDMHSIDLNLAIVKEKVIAIEDKLED